MGYRTPGVQNPWDTEPHGIQNPMRYGTPQDRDPRGGWHRGSVAPRSFSALGFGVVSRCVPVPVPAAIGTPGYGTQGDNGVPRHWDTERWDAVLWDLPLGTRLSPRLWHPGHVFPWHGATLGQPGPCGDTGLAPEATTVPWSRGDQDVGTPTRQGTGTRCPPSPSCRAGSSLLLSLCPPRCPPARRGPCCPQGGDRAPEARGRCQVPPLPPAVPSCSTVRAGGARARPGEGWPPGTPPGPPRLVAVGWKEPGAVGMGKLRQGMRGVPVSGHPLRLGLGERHRGDRDWGLGTWGWG